MPPRSAWSRWTLRFLGLLATAAFLAVGVISAKMILPDKKADAVAVPSPTATPAKSSKSKAKHKAKAKPKGPTKAQLAARAAAVAQLRGQGFTTLKLSDYDFHAALRVLIGRPVGDSAGGSYAFFFNKGAFLGKDAPTPTTKLSVVKQTSSVVTLAYVTSAGRVKVRFKLSDGALKPLDAIPPAGERFTPRSN
jgi:hypothetical protein